MHWLWHQDRLLFETIHLSYHRPWLDPIFWLISTTGLGWVQMAAVLLLARWRETRSYVLPLSLAWGISGGLKHVIDHVVPRLRPSNLPFAQPQEAFYHASFPSGHTASSFGIAFMLLILTWRKDWAWTGRAALAWAFLVGLSRIYRGVHWPTDILGGVFTGLIGATVVALLFMRSRRAAVAVPLVPEQKAA